MGKAQLAVELTVIASAIMLVLFLLFVFGQTKLNENASIASVSEARDSVDRLAKAAIEVHTEGVGARRKIYITIPDKVNPNRVMIGNGTITMGVYVENGTTDVSSPVGFTVVQGGYFPTTPGSYWVWVISRTGYVQIGSTIEINPLNIYFELFPTNSSSKTITLTNYGPSPVNVTLTSVWADSEVSVSVNGSSNTSFTLSPGIANLQNININASANSNASFGLHSGYITVTTNASEAETIPVLVTIVGQSGQQYYMTIETYNDSSYTYPNSTFSQSNIVYYLIRSYNSTNNLVNSTVTVGIYNPDMALMSQQTYSPNNGTGVYIGNYTISPNAPSGMWNIRAYEINGANALTYFSVGALGLGSTIIGSTYNATPFYSCQRAICRDSSNYIHIVWGYNTTQINYARSTDNGATFTVNTTFYGSISTATSVKSTPSISCNGNNITVAYVDATSNGVIVGISTDNGNTWGWNNPITSDAYQYVSLDRKGSRIYIVYTTGPVSYYNINFFNSTDGGSTWGPTTQLWAGQSPTSTGYYCPAVIVNGTGDSSDKLYVAVQKYNISQGIGFEIDFMNSSNAGASWGSEKLIIQSNDGVGQPSINTNSTNVLISSYLPIGGPDSIVFNTSADDGATWQGQQIS